MVGRIVFWTVATSVWIGCVALEPAPAQAQCEVAKLLAPNGTSNDRFGWSSAISGDNAIIGAYKSDDLSAIPAAFDSGVVLVYSRNGLSWNEIGGLVPAEAPSNGDEFGYAVALDGHIAVVGARKHDTNGQFDRGAVYVFRYDTETDEWQFWQELRASDGASGDRFGHAVAVDGDWIVVGAPLDDDAGILVAGASGSVYVFQTHGLLWTQVRKLVADDAAEGDDFGDDVAIEGDWIAVGAKWDDDACPMDSMCNSGAVYMFYHDPTASPDDWNQIDKLTAQHTDGTPDEAFNDFFGNAVSVSGDRLVVAARGNDDAGSNSGSAYIYRLEALDWVIEQKITASDAAASDDFGRSVAIRGDLVLVGAPRGDVDGPSVADSGSAYLYQRAGSMWTEVFEVTAGDAASGDRFGNSVAIAGVYASIGAHKAGGKGAVYVSHLVDVGDDDCNLNGVSDACDILVNSSIDQDADGVPDECFCRSDDDCAIGPFCRGPGSCVESVCRFAGDPCLSRGLLCDEKLGECLNCLDDSMCDDRNACTEDQCVLGICAHMNRPNDSPCDGDGSDCTEDLCNQGTCMHVSISAGTSCGPTNLPACRLQGTCDGLGHCESNIERNGTPCPGDENPCTDAVCIAGSCAQRPDSFGPGIPCAGDGDPCTDDVCMAGNCEHRFSPIGAACGSASDSSCIRRNCDGFGECLPATLPDGASCPTDGNECTDDVCFHGVCIHPPKPSGEHCGIAFEDRPPDTCDGAGSCEARFCYGHRRTGCGVACPGPTPCSAMGMTCSEDEDRCECPADGEIRLLFVDNRGCRCLADDGLTWGTAFRDLQDALAVASLCLPTEIRIAQGVYKPAPFEGSRGDSFLVPDKVSLFGGFAGRGEPDPNERDTDRFETVLSGDLLGNDQGGLSTLEDNSYHVITLAEDSSSTVLDGLTVTAGFANGRGGGLIANNAEFILRKLKFIGNRATFLGGGLCASGSGFIAVDCDFVGNRSIAGGAICFFHGSATFTDCRFQQNRATGEGGAIAFSSFSSGIGSAHVVLANCDFEENVAEWGGAVYGGANIQVASCRFLKNRAFFWGGGMVLLGVTSLEDGLFHGNSAVSFGGAVVILEASNPRILNCEFVLNRAGLSGGAIFDHSNDNTLVSNCSLVANTAGAGAGIAVEWGRTTIDRCTITGCTIVGNRNTNFGALGAGIRVTLRGNGRVLNTALWDNQTAGFADQETQVHVSGFDASLQVDFSIVQGMTPHLGGMGNIGDDPLFVAPGFWDDNGTPDFFVDDVWVDGDYRLSPGSPAIDAGTNDAVPNDVTTDLAGMPRIVDDPATPNPGGSPEAVVDIGAYEFQPLPQVEALLDILPGHCPNILNVRSHGVIEVALLGTDEFDVAVVDPDSLRLSRTDGTGGSVRPILSPAGLGPKLRDVSTPFVGQPCDCNDGRRDGVADLLFRFSVPTLVEELHLDSVPAGVAISLTLRGALQDGTTFRAVDCVLSRLGKPRSPGGGHSGR